MVEGLAECAGLTQPGTADRKKDFDNQFDDATANAVMRFQLAHNLFASTGGVLDARSEDILNAVDAAVADGMDVLHLSLGGGYHGNNDLLAIGLDNAVEAGVVVRGLAEPVAESQVPALLELWKSKQ